MTEYTYAQNRPETPIQDWWTVYADGNPIHHWATEAQAETFASHLRHGMDRDDARRAVREEFK